MGVYNNNKDGTRSTLANTIQVVDAPIEQFVSRGEFSAVTPSDVSADNKLVAENEVTKAVDTMPTASADLVGTIVQYIGEDTTDYKNGLFYKCISNSESTPIYSWVAISTQAKDYTELDNKPSINGQVLSGNKTSAQLNLATPREVRQFSTLNALTSYLASYVITNESLIYVRNYGTYYIITGRQSSDTEDDCIFVSDTQKLIPDIYHLENALLNINAFGALRSTNTVENSRLITKVIKFASSHGIGVFVPRGIWYIKETIPVSNILIIGETSSNVNAQASVTSSKLIFDPEQSNISMFTDSGMHSITLRHLTFECPYTTTNRSWVEVAETPHDYITWSYQYDNVNCLDIRNSRLDIFDVNIRGFSGFGLSCNQALSIESVRIFNGKYGFYNCKTDVQFHDSFIQGCEVGFMWDNSGTVLFAYNTWIDQCKYGVYSAGELSGLFDGGEIDHCLYAGICAYSVTTGLTVRARFGRLGMYYIGEDMLEKAKLITTYTDADFEDMSKGVDIAIKYAHNVNIDIDETPKYISDSQTGTNTLPSLFMYGRALNNTIIKTVYDFGDHTYYVFDSANSNVKVINVNSSDLPEGGTTGQVLIKSSDEDYDTEWSSALNEISEAVNIHEERRNIFDYTDVTDNKYRTSTLGSSINDSVDKANGWYSNQIWEVKKGDVIYQSTRWFPLLIYNENGILVEYRTSGDTGGVYTITDDNAKYLTIQASAHTDEYLYKLMLSINEPLPAEYVPYTDVRTVSQIDAVEEKIPTDGRAILDKGFVILTFDAFDDVNDARFDIVNEYGFKANAACTYGVSWEDISAKVLKQGWDAYLYSGHGYPTADSYYVDNPSAEVQAVWDSYVKEEVDYALSQGVSNPTAWGCRQGKSCDGLENACRKYGIKMVRGGAKATKFTEKFSYATTPPTSLHASTTQSCINAFTAAANVGYGVVFTTHGIYATTEEAETNYGMTEATLRQFLSALKTLVDEGKLEVLTFREVYQKYFQNDALYNNYDRLAYRAFGINLPTTPTTNGTYTLQVTVTDGVVTYSWV